LFESIERFLSRLDIYTRIPLTPAISDVVIKILVEVLSTLAMATRQVKQGRLSKSHPLGVVLILNAAQRNLQRKFLERTTSRLSYSG